jgi:hypothetical protein
LSEINKLGFPEIIYKYRHWSDVNHKRLLLKNEIYFASPIQFNDPFDCFIPLNFALLDTQEKLDQFIEQRRKLHTDTYKNDKTALEKDLLNYRHRLLFDRENLQNEYNSKLFEKVSKVFGVCSFSEEWNNILLWSHYGDCHKGFCVGFWQKKLQSFLEVGQGKVMYPIDNKYPEISPLDNNEAKLFAIQSFAKSSNWSHEKEFRLVKLADQEETSENFRIEIIPDDCFAEINLGINISEKAKFEIVNIARSKNIKIFELHSIPFKFEICRREI